MKMITIGQETVQPGESKIINLRVPRLYDHTEMCMPIKMVRGRDDGPTLLLTAAIHGDEINGIEIIRRILQHSAIKSLSGTLITVPIVNVYGFNGRSRYLPDRRDLNRCFPGSDRGSLGSQLAHILMTEVVSHATHVIDLHTGANHRTNLPQIRASVASEYNKAMAEAFGCSVIIDANVRDGSLRQAALDKGIPALVYEAGQALSYENTAIGEGVKGVLAVMDHIGMLKLSGIKHHEKEPFIAKTSYWVRASHSGLLRSFVSLGKHVESGEVMGVISDPFGEHEIEIKAKVAGLVIGHSLIPLVNRGDACFHMATFQEPETVESQIEAFDESLDYLPTMDPDH